MYKIDNNCINSGASIKDALYKINNLPESLTLFVIDQNQKLIGTLTDGDIRRGFLKGNSLEDVVDLFMSEHFLCLKESDLAIEVIKKAKQLHIKLLPKINSFGQIIKIIDLQKTSSLLPIDAVIMAGGRGERLRPLTDKVPKPMLMLGNKPIIEHNIDNLCSYGIENINITVRYLGEKIIEYFKDGSEKNIQINYIRENSPLGTIGSLSLINNYKSDVILVMNSDLFTDIDFEEFYLHFKENGADMSVASVPYSVSIPYAVMEIDNENICSFSEKPTYNYYSNAGIYLIKKDILKYIPKGKHFDATDLMQQIIDLKLKLTYFPIVGYWIDIGRKEDYNKALDFIKYMKVS